MLDSVFPPPLQASCPTLLFSFSVTPRVQFPLFYPIPHSSVLISMVSWSSVFFHSPMASLLPWAPSTSRPSLSGWPLYCVLSCPDISSLRSICIAVTVLIFKFMVSTCTDVLSVARTPCSSFFSFFSLVLPSPARPPPPLLPGSSPHPWGYVASSWP